MVGVLCNNKYDIMKKNIILAVLMAMALGASAQWFDFSNNTGRFDLGVHLGNTGIGTNYTDLGWGASASIYGVYIDCITAGPKYKYDNHVEVGPSAQVPDSTVLCINLGYQIPVLPWLRVMPIVGHCHTTAGYTDFSTVNVEVNGSGESTSAQMYHDYVKTPGSSRHYWNYGGGLVLQPVKWVSVYGVYTVRAIYGGLVFNLGEW